jgi:hypothetical protein
VVVSHPKAWRQGIILTSSGSSFLRLRSGLSWVYGVNTSRGPRITSVPSHPAGCRHDQVWWLQSLQPKPSCQLHAPLAGRPVRHRSTPRVSWERRALTVCTARNGVIAFNLLPGFAFLRSAWIVRQIFALTQPHKKDAYLQQATISIKIVACRCRRWCRQLAWLTFSDCGRLARRVNGQSQRLYCKPHIDNRHRRSSCQNCLRARMSGAPSKRIKETDHRAGHYTRPVHSRRWFVTHAITTSKVGTHF